MADERSIEAYRTMVDVLIALRTRLDTDMRGLFGQLWLGEQAPEPVRRRLAERKDREDAVAWYSTNERELFDYADFADISEVLQSAGPGILEGIFPQRELLTARLLELHVIQTKLAVALPVADQEMALLATITTRLFPTPPGAPAPHRPGAAPTASGAPAGPAQPPHSAAPAAPIELSTAPILTPQPAPPPQTPAPVAAPPPAPATAPATAAPMKASPATAPTAAAPMKAAPVAAPTAAPSRKPAPAAAAPRTPVRIEPPSPEEFAMGLERGSTAIVMRALYTEIMGGAEAMWGSGTVPPMRIWQLVAESPWYRESFVQLGLKPVSDYYGIVGDIIQSLGKTPTQEKVAELLNRRGFAQILLALRELFARHLK